MIIIIIPFKFIAAQPSFYKRLLRDQWPFFIASTFLLNNERFDDLNK
jgi:hypothetical protein